MNQGYYEEARDQFNGVLADDPAADYAYYGLAVLDCMTGPPRTAFEQSLPGHTNSIPKNRLQARSDNDFQSMVDDPRFTELLYPEIP